MESAVARRPQYGNLHDYGTYADIADLSGDFLDRAAFGFPVAAASDAVAFLPHAVPHLILAIAAVFAALFLLPNIFSLYGSLTIVILVYTISRISFATRILNNSLAQIHPELEEAALSGRIAAAPGDA